MRIKTMIESITTVLERVYSVSKEYAPVVGLSLLLVLSMVASGAILTQPVSQNQSGTVSGFHESNHSVIGFESGSLSPEWEIVDDGRYVAVDSGSSSEGNYSAILETDPNGDETAAIESNLPQSPYSEAINGEFNFSYDVYRYDQDNSDSSFSRFIITTDTGDELVIQIESGNSNPDRTLSISGSSVENSETQSTTFQVDEWLTVDVSGDEDTITATLVDSSGTELGTVTTNRTSDISPDNQMRLEADISDADVSDPYQRYDNIEVLEGPLILDPTLNLETGNYLEYGETQEYTVYDLRGENDIRNDVTSEATVTSGNTSIITVDENTNELTATTDENISARVNITAVYDGRTDVTQVTVADQTIENLDVLPFLGRTGAMFLDRGFQMILVGLLLSIAATRVGGVYAGLGIYQMSLTAGWLIGWVPIGLAMVGLFTVLFVGLNIAANIDYSVRR